MYTETFITDITIEEISDIFYSEEPLYFNDEWLDEDEDLDALAEMSEEYEPDDEFFAYVDDIEPDFDEVGFDPYAGCYSYDC